MKALAYFRSPAAWRSWLKAHHRKAQEVWVGFYRKSSGNPSVTWPESVDEALCFGWIDGIRKTVDHERYAIRFTPRRPGSTWSTVNIRKVKMLEAAGKMTDVGRASFDARLAAKSGTYSYEQRTAGLDETRNRALRREKAAWAYFEAQPPGYRKKVSWWVMSARMEEVRDRRFQKLLASCIAQKRLA